MKRAFWFLVSFVSASAFATEMTKDQIQDVEALLAEGGAKSLYLTRECDKPIDPDKFRDLSKLKAISEGYPGVDGIDWENVKRESHIGYAKMKLDAPLGEACPALLEELKGKYRWLRDINA